MEPGDPTAPAFEVLTGSAAFAECATKLVAGARNEVAIQSYGFDPRVYGTEAFADAVRAFVLMHRRARLRVLVNQPRLAMRRAHRVVELGRQLSSRIEFREMLPERKELVQECVIADLRSFLLRPSTDHLESKFWADAPLSARERLRTFNALWEESVPAQELRDLRL